jgi:hypothetical protein
MNSRNPKDLSEADIDMPDIFCMGEHAFALDEEIGIVCRVCKFVKQEIGGIFPSLVGILNLKDTAICHAIDGGKL